MRVVIFSQIFSSLLLLSSSIRIQRRQLLDGTAKNDGVAPKPPGSDNVFENNIITALTTRKTEHKLVSTTTKQNANEFANDRSNKETVTSNSSSNASLIASIVAPTGILGIIGAAVGAFFYKKNQTNSSSYDIRGFFNNLFSANSNAVQENKPSEE
ncbi:unnamed protein product [Adineta ricciae]|uniref:Uncharacterized protein n=1 Tax=Adineta ricciae TaxID=249248 RepID=A0A813VNG8_ADIRI|nr:unnamed protein product [Adineta ricciae]